MLEKFYTLTVDAVPTASHGMLVNSVTIDGTTVCIGKYPYLEAYPQVDISLGNLHLLKTFPENIWEAERDKLEKILADLILQLKLGDKLGIIGTHADLNTLIELCSDFDIADLNAPRLERYMIHPELMGRICAELNKNG